MMLNIGSIAKTYGVLPSQVLGNATTYDLMIADVMSSWEEHQINKATNKLSPPNLTVAQMSSILEKARSR